MGMAVSDIFDTEVVEDEAEEGRSTFLAPKAGSGGALVLSMLG